MTWFFSLGNESAYISGIHTNVTTVQLPSGQAGCSYPRDETQSAAVFMCIDAVCRKAGFGSTSEIAMFR